MMTRVRTIDAAYDEIKRLDPGTAISRTGLRRLVVSGTVPSVRAGKKFLVDLDAVEQFFLASSIKETGSKKGE